MRRHQGLLQDFGKVFAVGFNGDFFFHTVKFNVEICVKLGKI